MKKLLMIFVFVLATAFMAFGQTVRISGQVTTVDDGGPIPGVTVVAKGTTIGTVTDTDGRYNIDVPSGVNTLVFSFIGFKTTEADINGQTTIDVAIQTDLLLVDEVIVVAYGTTKREAFTGSASSVKVDKLSEVQVSNVTKALECLSSGIQVISG